MTIAVRATCRIEWKNVLIQTGSLLLLDDVHLDGEVYVNLHGMQKIPFREWIKYGWLVELDEGCLVAMSTYDETYWAGCTNKHIEPMFHFMVHQHYKYSTIDFNLVGAEVGVWRGDNADNILQTMPIKKLYLIDSYDENPEYQLGNLDLKAAKEFAYARLAKYGDRVGWIYQSSKEALPRLEGMLDFCYHDSDHRRPCVTAELPLGYNAVKSGGVWGGHDYKNTKAGSCEVKACVDEFFIKRGLSPLWYSPRMLNWWHVKS